MDLLEKIPIPAPVIQWVVFSAVLLGIGSLVVMPLFLISMSRDHFLRPETVPLWGQRRPVAYFFWRILRNATGAVLVLLGIAMLVLPGQGLLTILVGLVLLEFPGKRALELRLLRRARITRSINWIRRKAGREALELPPPRQRRKKGERFGRPARPARPGAP